jgi:1A family penicillin-binding protein
MRHTKHKTKIKNTLFIIGGLAMLIISLSIVWISSMDIPDFKSFTERKVANSTKIYDNTGEILLYDLHKDMRRTVIPGSDIGVNIKNAAVAIEDAEFYNHNGIRVKSIIRALWQRFLGNKNAGGGSTITQQLIKNTLLTQEKTITRKLKEWVLAIKIERVLSKEEILSLYLNEAPYGGTIYGIQEGSKNFFDKNPADLTLAEAAYMAAIPNSPTFFSPYGKNKEKLDQRKNLVLNRMFELGFITQTEYEKAKSEVVVFQPQKPTSIQAPHFVFFIKDYLEKKYGADVLESGGLIVTTTLNYELQKKAEAIVAEKAKENEKNADGKNAAVVVIDANTGGILAMVGSRDYFNKEIDGNFNVVTAQRQPGSSFKPFVYAAAFNKGYTADTVLFDVKTEFSTACNADGTPKSGNSKNECYNPDNYDDAFRGPMTLRDALAQSINVIAVKLLYLVGEQDAIRLAHEMGITSLNDSKRYGLSLVIGGGEVSLLDLASAYSVFATEGVRHPYQGILSIKDNTGQEIEKIEDRSNRVLPENTTRIVSDILSDNVARVPTFGANSSLVVPGVDVAVKTGTTNNNKDAWTLGYTPNVVVGAWVGNNDNKPMKKGGAALAGPIWNQVMTEAVKLYPQTSFNKPDAIDKKIPPVLRGFWRGNETFVIDSISKKLATEFTPENTKQEISITNVHTILYWINKDNPLSSRVPGSNNDSLYSHFEYGVQRWWVNNSYKYPYVSAGSVPKDYDNIHTENSKPVIGFANIDETVVYDKNIEYKIVINQKSSIPLQKIDIFINNIYVKSIKSAPFSFSLNPMDISNLNDKNVIRAIAYDVYGNVGEVSVLFQVQ